MKKSAVIASIAVLLFLSAFSAAAIWTFGDPLVPCGNEPDDMCTFPDFLVMINNIVQFALFYVAVPIGVIWIIVGGFFMMTAGGNEGRFGKGKKIIYSVLIALLIAFGAWLIVDTVLGFLNIKGD
ncbi:MAG: hypothetical protein UW85_C0017G0005 [Parcubacteria group bacterium GW2011_GWA1_Parcubacteria_45_10]|nr:MAG: hypothetical protein UW85_C0017G0005 [Parcubacteria group bacterium GW2011_GWA1_Parcubacteria_45_10]